MTDEIAVIDDIDRQILGILRDDGRIPWQALGARVHLSPNAAADRVRRLVRLGVITRFTAVIDQARLGRTLEAVVDVRVHDTERFRSGALAREEVASVLHVTGRSDYQVHVACAGTAGLNALLLHFRDDLGVQETHTTVVLERDR